jgi:hypothetical protein
MRMGYVLLLLIGILVALAIPAWIAIFALVGIVMPWFVLGLIVWVGLSAVRGSRRRRWTRTYWPPRPAPSSQGWAPVQPTPEPVPNARPELPVDVQVKVEQIRRKADVLLGYASRFPPFSKDLYLVRQTASEYLPRTIDAYLALPLNGGETIVAADGKSALQELKEQLDLLDWKLDEVAEDIQRQDLDRMLANRRFLEERFGRAQLSQTIPPP